jgi:hypothetical protein
MMAASELGDRKRKRASSTIRFPARTQSQLERLPVELIELIFLHALEINMAQASPLIRKIVSKESIYRALILYALFEDDGQHPVEEKQFEPAPYRLLAAEEMLHLQRGVLKSRWFTFSRMRQCHPTLTRLNFIKQWHRNRNEELERAKLGMQPLPQTDPYVQFPYYSAVEASQILSSIEPILINGRLPYNGRFNLSMIPNRLLNPVSWHNNRTIDNPDPVKFLSFLWYHGMELHYSDLKDWPRTEIVVFHGLQMVIRERHREALNILLKIYLSFFSRNDTIKHGDARTEMPKQLLHLATRQGPDSEWILEFVFRSFTEYALIPKDDEVLTKWALGQQREGSEFAKFVLDMMAANEKGVPYEVYLQSL